MNAKFAFEQSTVLEAVVKRVETSMKKVMFKMSKDIQSRITKIVGTKKLARGDDVDWDAILDDLQDEYGVALGAGLAIGQNKSYLFGEREIGTHFGYKHGEIGPAGTFDFKTIPKGVIKESEQIAAKISDSTIENFVVGNKRKFLRQNVRTIVQNGVDAGLSSTEINEKIAKLFKNNTEWKVAEITRTEVPRAYNNGRMAAGFKAGAKKARIILGGRPCSWCIANAPLVKTMAQAQEYFAVHHITNDCSILPIL